MSIDLLRPQLVRSSNRWSTRASLGTPLGLVGLVLWIVTIARADFARMGPWGLVSVLGWTYFAGLVVVVAGLAFELLRTPLRVSRVTFLLMVLVVFLYGTACAIEPLAGRPDSWIHAGFIQYIVQHGHTLNGFDARFSWPGGFSLGAVLVAFAGQVNALGFLRWFPFMIEMAYLAPLLVIARWSGVSRRAGLLGIALYYATNWIYQDYFSPQALNFLFYLVVIAVVLASWRPRTAPQHGPTMGFWRERIVQSRRIATLARLEGHDATTRWSDNVTLGLLALLGLISLASSMSHQITPFALALALGACLVARRLGRPELAIAVGVLAIGWVSLGASNFWVGHLHLIFGSVGQVSSTVGSNVTGRVIGSPSHLFIVELRILITAALFLAAGIGFLRRSADSRVLEVLAAAPFLLIAMQNYGGEGFLRVVFFGLPFTSLLAASAILPSRGGSVRALLPSLRVGRYGRAAMRIAVAAIVLGFSVATTVARGGNDAYEAFSHGELAAVNYAYDHVRTGQTIGAVSYFLPLEFRDVNVVNLLTVDGGGGTVRADGSSLLRARPFFIILSRSQEQWGEVVMGYPRGWETTIEERLLAHGYRIAAHWGVATVLQPSVPVVRTAFIGVGHQLIRGTFFCRALGISTGPCAG